MARKYFGTDGIRGRVGEHPITPEFMLKLGWAAGMAFRKQGHCRILVGKDTRISGYMFESALEAGLAAAGVTVQLLGPMPTPAVAYLTRTFQADAGIVISASHNAYHDNGIKFFSRLGSKLPDDVELEIERLIDQPMVLVNPEFIGKAVRINDAPGRYIEFCKSSVPTGTNFNGIKVVVDCANGATYKVAPSVLHELGAEVIVSSVQPNGLNINDGCGSTYTAPLVQKVLQNQADMGIAFDGDGDRVLMVDHEGLVIDGDTLLYIIAQDMKNKGLLNGGVVGTQMSNLGLELKLASMGIDFTRAKVGDRYVMAALQEHGWILGGENSGHIICHQHTTTGDAIVAALQVLLALKHSGQNLSELSKQFSKFPQVLINVKHGGSLADPVNHQDVQAATLQVTQAMQGRGRVLLRCSGTEPLVRVMVEGEDELAVRGHAEHLAQVVSQVCSSH